MKLQNYILPIIFIVLPGLASAQRINMGSYVFKDGGE